jgi:hypothetical protein
MTRNTIVASWSSCWLRILVAGICVPSGRTVADVTLTNASSTALADAVQNGGQITLAFNGTVALTNTLLVLQDTTLDASAFNVTLDGGGAARHFVVTNGVRLRLVNFALRNGRSAGETGQTNQPGNPAFGGSILNAGGKTRVRCLFQANRTNLFSASPDLLQWTALGTRISDTNGVEVEDTDMAQGPLRFYMLQIQEGP